MKPGRPGPTLPAYDPKTITPGVVISEFQNSLSSIGMDGGRWKSLDKTDQLDLALKLCYKALPVWEKYVSGQAVTYLNSTSGPIRKIDCKILELALDEIKNIAQKHPCSGHKTIDQLYCHFIEPVIDMQDGIWVPPYPVKKIFLAVYYIVKSFSEQNNFQCSTHFMSASIHHSLDCLDMISLYSKEEIDEFLEVFKNKV